MDTTVSLLTIHKIAKHFVHAFSEMWRSKHKVPCLMRCWIFDWVQIAWSGNEIRHQIWSDIYFISQAMLHSKCSFAILHDSFLSSLCSMPINWVKKNNPTSKLTTIFYCSKQFHCLFWSNSKIIMLANEIRAPTERSKRGEKTDSTESQIIIT